jgi:hypothetical protein
MSMTGTRELDAPQRFLVRLLPIIRFIFAFLEAGIKEAYKLHEDKKARRIDPWYFAHTVRWSTWLALDELRRAGSVKFLLGEKPMSGLEVAYDNLSLKILRPEDDELPEAKNEQQKLFYGANIFNDGTEEFFSINSLVLVWEYEPSTQSLTAKLVCPRPDGSMYWSVPVPHPATLVEAPPEPQPQDDLVYERNDQEEQSPDQDQNDESEGADDRRTT